MDALSAVCSAGECGDPKREVGRGHWVVECAGAVVSAGADGEGSRVGTSSRADRTAEADLPISLCAEGGAQTIVERGSTCHVAICRDAKHSTSKSGGRRGCVAPDVTELRLLQKMKLFAGLETDSLAGSDGDFRACPWVAANAG